MRISDWSSDVCSSDLAIETIADPLCQLADAPLDDIQGVFRKRAYCAAQFGRIRYDIVGRACMNLRKAQHGGIVRIAVTRNDGWECLKQLRCRHDRLDAHMRHGRMRALPRTERKGGGEGKRWSVRVTHGGS